MRHSERHVTEVELRSGPVDLRLLATLRGLAMHVIQQISDWLSKWPNPQLAGKFYDAITSLWQEIANGRSGLHQVNSTAKWVAMLQECMGRHGKAPGMRMDRNWWIRPCKKAHFCAILLSSIHADVGPPGLHGWIKAAQARGRPSNLQSTTRQTSFYLRWSSNPWF